MSKFQKNILFVFFLLLIYDLYDCTKVGFDVSIWFRPVQMIVLCLFVFNKNLTFLNFLLIFSSLLLTSIIGCIFYSTGLLYGNIITSLLLIKNLCFIIVLQNSKEKLRFSMKLLRWILTHLILSAIVCFLIVGNENLYFYLLALQSGIIILLISLQIKELSLFRQMYLGYSLMIFATIFGKIFVADSRWFIEIIARLALIFGHLLFISALADIKLIGPKANTLGSQTVKES